MKTKISLLTMVMILGMSCISFAQVNTGMSVEDIQICTSVKDHMPVDANTTFSADVGRLYCFTRIINSAGNNKITHVWYFNGKEMARVELSVAASSWRTWSSKRILPQWKGDWRVDVLSSDGTVLASKKFVIK